MNENLSPQNKVEDGFSPSSDSAASMGSDGESLSASPPKLEPLPTAASAVPQRIETQELTIRLNVDQKELLRRRMSDANSTVQCYRGDLIELTRNPSDAGQPIGAPSIHAAPTRIIPGGAALDRQVDQAWTDVANGSGPPIGALPHPAEPGEAGRRRWVRWVLVAAAAASIVLAAGGLGQRLGGYLVVEGVRPHRSGAQPQRPVPPPPGRVPETRSAANSRAKLGEAPPPAPDTVSHAREGSAPGNPAAEGDSTNPLVRDDLAGSHHEPAQQEGREDSPARFLWAENETDVVREQKSMKRKRLHARGGQRHRASNESHARKKRQSPTVSNHVTATSSTPQPPIPEPPEPKAPSSLPDGMINLEELGVGTKPVPHQ